MDRELLRALAAGAAALHATVRFNRASPGQASRGGLTAAKVVAMQESNLPPIDYESPGLNR